MLYAEKDYYRLETRLNDMTKLFDCKSVEDLHKLFQGPISPDMNAVLLNVSTNNETYFLRDVKPFTALTESVIPEMQQKHTSGPFRIWSCASSTGQEAFSILMAIDSKLPPAFFQRVEIEGSDISAQALAKAKEGVYNGLDVQRGLPINLLMKYFEQQDSGDWKVSEKLKSKAFFKEFNLLTGTFPNKKFHVIFCRNVLIYQDKDNKNKILNCLYNALLPGGYLFMGSGESLIGMATDYEKVLHSGITLYKRPEDK